MAQLWLLIPDDPVDRPFKIASSRSIQQCGNTIATVLRSASLGGFRLYISTSRPLDKFLGIKLVPCENNIAGKVAC